MSSADRFAPPRDITPDDADPSVPGRQMATLGRVKLLIMQKKYVYTYDLSINQSINQSINNFLEWP